MQFFSCEVSGSSNLELHVTHLALAESCNSMNGNWSLSFVLNINIITSKFNEVTGSLHHKTSVGLQGNNVISLKDTEFFLPCVL